MLQCIRGTRDNGGEEISYHQQDPCDFSESLQQNRRGREYHLCHYQWQAY